MSRYDLVSGRKAPAPDDDFERRIDAARKKYLGRQLAAEYRIPQIPHEQGAIIVDAVKAELYNKLCVEAGGWPLDPAAIEFDSNYTTTIRARVRSCR